jgi:hypothetical protein
VDQFEDEFRARLKAPKSGAAGWLREGDEESDLDHLELGIADPEDLDIDQIMWEVLVRAVGDEAALETLDAAPLPDEPFDWSDIPADVHDNVEQILTRCDHCCDALFDTELRTACRRVLARVASGDPQAFRRKGKPATAAAAICWITAKANDRLSYAETTAKELVEWFGVGSNPGARAQTFLKAGGWQPQHYGRMDLASPAYLTGGHRRHLIELRERYRT